ncbi:polysaccharide pyruvyl transferase family protein [Aestuariibacter sp. A3R04]|uniref:polysaccharide pyruvyl transferase family protein n=1 Tax=Aestuariibacter sp. A3R04 TaxID=2841571 RepID=UPI001C09C138|nr:polysaccharide pyruvyl transferase family protein [Aestuariibacter sp. A3R04]MBU3023387.1 polysaccharide pyruvyl transferase family protein [Aestuariibacter sp. A3R04]
MTKLMGLGSGNNKLVTNYKELYLSASSNTGNLLFNYALEQLIELSGTDVRWSTPAEKINQMGESLLIPMANNIGRHMDLEKSGPKIKDVEVPVVVMGLGAQFPLDADFEQAFNLIPDSSKTWLETLCSKSNQANVSVRGKLTHRVFEKLGLGHKAVPLGCPSHFLSNNKNLGQLLQEKSKSLLQNGIENKIGITAGNPAIANLVKLEQFLISQINNFGGMYIVQHPKDLICLAENWLADLTEDEINMVQERFFPNASSSQMHQWFRSHAHTYVSIPQWFRDISKTDFVTGTRIHGCQIALQAGVPAVCLHIDSRTKELCETMQIPTIPARDFQKAPSMDQLLELVATWDWEQYDANRMDLAKKTRQFVEDNGLSPSSHFQSLVS